MGLYLVELTRLRWRRAVVGLCLLAAAISILVVSVLAWNTRPISDADRASVDVQLEQLKEDNLREHERMMADCAEHPENYGVDETVLCEEIFYYEEPDESWLGFRQQLDGQMAVDSGTAVAIIAILLALLLGATYAGADWNTGSMSNQLLFRPRRTQVWLAKAGAAFTAGAVTGALAATLYWSTIAVLNLTRDVELGAGFTRDTLELAGRGILFAGCAAMLGCCLAMLLRSTVATLGVIIAAGVGSTILFNALPIDGIRRWTIDLHLMAVLRDGWEAEVWKEVCDGGMGCTDIIRVSLVDGILYFGVVLVVVMALSLLSFRRRDVP